MGKTIVIVSQSHICRNPRALKEALLLAKTGYDVTVLTGIYSEKLLQEDLDLLQDTSIKYKIYSDLRTLNPRSLIDRIIKKFASELKLRFNIESKFTLGFGINRLLKICIFHNADLYIMHQELSMVTGCQLLKKKYNVAFDIEDWYSEDLLERARKKRPIKLLRRAEKFALQNSPYCYTTSNSMASGLMDAYQSKHKPTVIYNSFDTTHSLCARLPDNLIRLYWFSQTIGPGRGLEFFLDCLAASKINWSLTLRGDVRDEYKLYLINKVSKKENLIFLPSIPNREILKDLSNYDFGLALEPNLPQNKNLTISNKFFHYMAGGLPIIASNTSGHSEIGRKHPEIIFLYENGNSDDLLSLLNNSGTMLSDLPNIKKKVIRIYEVNYCWEHESKKLINLIDQAIFKNVSGVKHLGLQTLINLWK